MKTSSRFALVAAAGLMMGSLTLSAKAADLGASNSDDLEQRVADLEATTVRKGNRKVSVQLYGDIDKALMVWNDGKSSDAYVVDNFQQSTRMGLKGTGQISQHLKAGFNLEYEFNDGSAVATNQFDSSGTGLRGGESVGGTPLRTSLRLRQSNAYLESDQVGRVTIGLQSVASKDITNINLGGSLGDDPENYMLQGFYLRDNSLGANATSGTGTPGAGAAPTSKAALSHSSSLTLQNFFNSLDTTRIEALRYDTPSIYGFVASAAWGGNDFWDVALRYQKEWNSVRFAAGIGYQWISGRATDNGQPASGDGYGITEEMSSAGYGGIGQRINNCNGTGTTDVNNCVTTKAQVVSGSASLMHVPTGIYGTFAAGVRMLDNTASETLFAPTLKDTVNKDATYYYGQLGITKRWFDVGTTTIYGEYGNYRNFAVGDSYGLNTDGTALGTTGNANIVTSSEVNRYGVGFVQAFDKAALELYTVYNHYDISATTQTQTSTTVGSATLSGVNTSRTPDSMDVVMSGARIKF